MSFFKNLFGAGNRSNNRLDYETSDLNISAIDQVAFVEKAIEIFNPVFEKYGFTLWLLFCVVTLFHFNGLCANKDKRKRPSKH